MLVTILTAGGFVPRRIPTAPPSPKASCMSNTILPLAGTKTAALAGTTR
jgi:hypothetical protein